MTGHRGPPHTRAGDIRVLVVDDHEVVRRGLQRLLDAQPDLAVTGTASDGMAAIEMATTLLPDLVLMDLDMPVLNGVLATREILRRTPRVRVLAFTGYADAGMIEAALEAGACGCASKWDGCEELLDAVRWAMTTRCN